MMKTFAKAMRDDAGVSALEFGLTVPVFILLFSGLADFALAFWKQGVLASSVAEGAQYSILAGPTVSGPAIQTVVARKLALPTSNVTVTGPSCYCLYSSPVAASPIQSCTVPCADTTVPGTYVTISARYTYVPIMPLYSRMASSTLVETTTARLK